MVIRALPFLGGQVGNAVQTGDGTCAEFAIGFHQYAEALVHLWLNSGCFYQHDFRTSSVSEGQALRF